MVRKDQGRPIQTPYWIKTWRLTGARQSMTGEAVILDFSLSDALEAYVKANRSRLVELSAPGPWISANQIHITIGPTLHLAIDFVPDNS